MSAPRNRTVGEAIYSSIDTNEYLLKLYNELLKAYTRKLFDRTIEKFNDKQLNDLLVFADILSKSTDKEKSGIHKIWSQQIVALLDKVMPNNYKIKFYKYSVLNSCNNYQGLKTEKTQMESLSVFDELIQLSDKEYFKVPTTQDNYFFEDQKSIFDGFSHRYFSYSAPTSMGKSYVMRVFIKQQIINGSTDNFAILVPTKALINEIRTKILEDLDDKQIKENNYRVITSASDIFLEQDHHFIFIMTPERFIYLLNTTDKRVKYLFIDEAHKISTKDSRSPFYYQLVDKVSKLPEKPHVIFSSPNIPEPQEYLKLINGDEHKSNKRALFAPVSQIKYLIDLSQGSVKAYNDYSKEFILMGNRNAKLDLTALINHVSQKSDQNIIYCSSLRETIDQAITYASNLSPLNDKYLDDLSDDIKSEINKDYFLVDLIRKGVAFHVGYLPANLRLRIEAGFKEHKIRTLFCTSTLIEGVNLPADNLFITSYYNGQRKLDKISFRNLIGRVGRIDHSLFGNVFMVNLTNSEQNTIKEYEELLTKDITIKDQKLSLFSVLKESKSKVIIDSLVDNDFEMTSKPDRTTAEQFTYMRKAAMIMLDDLAKGETSLVTETLMSVASKDQIARIKQNLEKLPKYESIDVSPDQHINLSQFVENGAKYPDLVNGAVDYDDVVMFLNKLGDVFKWQVYEKKTLGYYDQQASNYSHISWYSIILYKWMSGYGLNFIVKEAIEYKERNPQTGIWANNWKIEDYYNKNDPKHKNLIIADTLNTIENIILFSVANYFREFSAEYKKQHDNLPFNNDWYEYVEYGTTNNLTIILQRYGYSREAARYIIDNKKTYVDETSSTSTAPFVLKKDLLLQCRNESAKSETPLVFKNAPELFI